MGFLYIVKLREFIMSGANVYKIGRTDRTLKKRLRDYPKGSELIYFVEVENNTNVFETKFIKLLKENEDIRQCIEYGTEYFEGKIEEIKIILHKVINENTNELDDYERDESERENIKKEIKIKCPFCKKQLSRVEKLKYHIENSVCSSNDEERKEVLMLLNMDISTTLEHMLQLRRKTNEMAKREDDMAKREDDMAKLKDENKKLMDDVSILKRNNKILIKCLEK